MNKGWIDTVCLTCASQWQVITWDNYVVNQEASGCLAALNNKVSRPENFFIDYNADAWGGMSKVASYDYFFDNTKSSLCPVQTCLLKEVGCKKMMDSSRYLQIQGTPPTELWAAVKEENGYIMNFCILCRNSAGVDAELDNIILTQAKKL